MLTGWSEFAERHWALGGILASLLWFLAGKQSFSNRKADAAIGYQLVAVAILLIMGAWAIAKGEWLGLAAALAVLYVEVRSIHRGLNRRGKQGRPDEGENRDGENRDGLMCAGFHSSTRLASASVIAGESRTGTMRPASGGGAGALSGERSEGTCSANLKRRD